LSPRSASIGPPGSIDDVDPGAFGFCLYKQRFGAREVPDCQPDDGNKEQACDYGARI